MHLATFAIYPFGKHRCDNRAFRCSVFVPFCNCTGVTTVTLAAAVWFFRRGVPSANTVWVILKRGYVFNLTQLFIKKYIFAANRFITCFGSRLGSRRHSSSASVSCYIKRGSAPTPTEQDSTSERRSS